MSGIKLTEAGEIDLTNGRMRLTAPGTESTKQRLDQRLTFFLAEWFLDKSRGLPWLQQVFVKNPNPVVIDAVIKREILSDPAVLKLESFVMDLDTETREMTVTFRALTTDGPVDLSVTVGV